MLESFQKIISLAHVSINMFRGPNTHADTRALVVVSDDCVWVLFRPLRVEFESPWAGEDGKRFAAYTQHDLITHKKRGVRRVRKTKDDKDYLYYRWVTAFPRVPSTQVYEVYSQFLEDLRDDKDQMVTTHLEDAWGRLQSMVSEGNPSSRESARGH